MTGRKITTLLIVAVMLFGATAIAFGQSSKPDSTSAPTASSSGFFTFQDFYNRKYLLGDWGGTRTKLEENGVVFDFHYVNDLLYNVKGGSENKAAGWNRVRGTMDLDLGRMWHPLNGFTVHVTGLWQGGVNLGGGISPTTGQPYFGSIANPSGLVSAHTTRLDSFWLQYSMFNGKLVVRAGQFAGQDFYGVSEVGQYYRIEPLDYAFGNLFTTYESYDPASGPAAEIKIAPIKHFYYRTAVMSGNHNPYGDDPNGFHFTAKNKGSWLNEVGLTVGDSPADSSKKQYPGKYKVGSSFNPDYFLNPVTQAYNHKNYLVYFMANQAVYRFDPGSDRGLDFHFAMDFAPQDYNRIDRQITGGVIFHGPIQRRPKDAVACGIVWSHVSDNYNTFYSNTGLPVLGSEKAIEVSYRTQATPWLVFQPVAQIYHDLGANPANGTGVILGFSTKVTF